MVLIRTLETGDYDQVIEVFGHYVSNSMAAYMDQVPTIDFLLNGHIEGSFLVLECEGKVAGFGKLKRYHSAPVFDQSALIGYFIHPDFTGKGYGRLLLDELEERAKRMGVKFDQPFGLYWYCKGI